MTGCAMDENEEKRWGPWIRSEEKPQGNDIRRMLVAALEVSLRFVMENHVYKFEKEIKKQTRGGPIGLELTGVLAQIFMMWWDKQFLKKMKDKQVEVLMYKRYVDDINIVMKTTPRRMNPHENMENDEQNALLIQEVGDSIHKSINIEVDYPNKHADKKLPILDLKVWVSNIPKIGEEESQNKIIMHEFYAKSVSSKMLIHSKSAVPQSMKRTVITQQMLRVLLNCSDNLPWDRVKEHLECLVMRMQFSGYDKHFRRDVILSAVKAYREIKEKDQAGIEPMYRPRHWKKQERVQQKNEKRERWYENDGCESVIFIPSTPGSELKKKIKKKVTEHGFKIKVVEKSNKSIKQMVQRSNPFKESSCNRPDCLVCTTEGRGPCQTAGVTYEVKCRKCEKKYIGETSRTAYCRGVEHLKAIQKEDENSALVQHIMEEHGGEESDFVMNTTGIYSDDAMLRQISEAVKIKYTKNHLNKKEEWRRNYLPRMHVTNK